MPRSDPSPPPAISARHYPERRSPPASTPAQGWGRLVPTLYRFLWLAATTLGSTLPARAQETLHYSLAGQVAAEANRAQIANQPYTFKNGDFKLLVTPSLGFEYNDNINVSRYDALDDFIIKPFVQFTASYPIGQRNLLQLDVGVGYDAYIQHSDYSGPRLRTGSQVAFDFYSGDFRFDVHDRFEYIGDAAGNSAVANNANFQYFQNTAGLGIDWDLQDIISTFGYDHLNYISATSENDYLNHSTEMFLARTGLKVHPELTVGVEGTAAPTDYNQNVLNNNVAYSAGVYGIWNPGPNFSLQPRLGYALYDFDQTSATLPAQDQNTWYVDTTLRHQPTAAITYGVSLGHEARLGVQSDLIEDTYFRPNLTWNLMKNVSLLAGVFYEHGTEHGGSFTTEDAYDWYGGSIGATYSVMKNLQASLTYRLTLRSSDTPSDEYTQNLVSLLLTYTPR
jgi:hypothetical protein